MKKIAEKSEKRRKIIIAARVLFNHTHNVKRVSLEAIAREAGVSPTTIYNNFGDRETLVYEVIKELVRTNLERNRALIRSGLPFAQKLVGIVSGKMDVAGEFNAEIIEKLVGQDKNIAPFIDKIMKEEIRPLWGEMVADGKKQGYIDPALDDEALLAYMDILQAGLRAKPEVFKGFQNNMDFVQQLMRLMFYGFLKREIDLFQKEGK
jgi:AcrR family transcriptional regulator